MCPRQLRPASEYSFVVNQPSETTTVRDVRLKIVHTERTLQIRPNYTMASVTRFRYPIVGARAS